MTSTASLPARSPSPPEPAPRFLPSHQLCAEALAGIADPLFPALATARVVAPSLAVRAALQSLLEPLDSPGLCDAMPSWLLPHQADAVARARAILRRFGGVLLADGVGLGKTYIALALAWLERSGDGDAVAFVPSPLLTEWRRAAEAVNVPLTVYSHAQLSRRAPALPARCSLIVVDEAHAFRNPRTRRYDALAQLAARRRVALLSATPLNNSPADLSALVRLFAARDRFRELGVSDLDRALRQSDPAASLALGALSVCRTRRLVEATFPALRGAFPRRVLRPSVRYDLDACFGGSLPAILGTLAELVEQAGDDPGAALTHLVLVRRLESSRPAFRRSLARQRDVMDAMLRATEQGVAVTRAEVRASWTANGAGGAQLMLWPLLTSAAAEPTVDSIILARAAVQRAIALTDAAGAPDPKADALLALLTGSLRGSRAIVFTEYRDTALHLLRRLRDSLRVIAVTGDAAWAGTTVLSRREALDAFAPIGRGRPRQPLLDADVLIATDVASEGLNLQDARVVVNYDLPWNPVRVMQRVGRIERLNSPHDSIEVAHLAPDGGLRELTAVLRTLRSKLDGCTHAVGPEPDPLAALWWVDSAAPQPEVIEHESYRRVALFEARERWRALSGSPQRRSPVALIAAAQCDDDAPAEIGVLLALEWRNGRRVPLPFVLTGAGQPVCDPQALGALCERALPARQLPVDAADFTGVLATILPDARARLLELSAARHGAAEPGPGRRAALDLLAGAARDAHRRRRHSAAIERAVDLLAHDTPEGLDRLIGRLVRGTGAPDELAARLAELLDAPAPMPAGPPRLVLVAALLLTSRCPSG